MRILLQYYHNPIPRNHLICDTGAQRCCLVCRDVHYVQSGSYQINMRLMCSLFYMFDLLPCLKLALGELGTERTKAAGFTVSFIRMQPSGKRSST